MLNMTTIFVQTQKYMQMCDRFDENFETLCQKGIIKKTAVYFLEHEI